MKSTDQPLLPLARAREAGAPPMRIRVAISALDTPGTCCVVREGSPQDSAAWQDRQYPACAPHRMATFVEEV